MISSMVPRASAAFFWIEKVIESPVPKAAAMIRVLIIMPTMMSMVWDLRRGMLRRASFSITRLRDATTPIPAVIGRKNANRTTMMTSMSKPKSSSIFALELDYGIRRLPVSTISPSRIRIIRCALAPTSSE